ncbi:MAG: chemotaxis protein CheW [Deltaproteobacteria bacterium]|nr:chemotaxis protein CheW [Deltaproteobacteria bacterium]
MSEEQQNQLLSLVDFLSEEDAKSLSDLAPGITWAMDTLVYSFREDVEVLEQAAQDAFYRLTFNYGMFLDRFLKLARGEVTPEQRQWRREKMEKLRKLDLFKLVNDFDLDRIAGAFVPRIYKTGEVLAQEGEPGTAVYFLEAGQIGIFAGGNQVAVRGPGNLFGEMSCLTNMPVTATLRAVSECEVLVLAKADFETEVLQLPDVVPQFAKMGVSRLGDITNRLSEVLSHMPDALLKLDKNGMITGDVSKKCFEYLNQEVLTGKRFSSLIFKDDPESLALWDKHFANLWDKPESCQDENFPIPREVAFNLEGLGMRHYELTLFATKERGVLAGFDVAIADLTDRKEIEEARAKMERALRNIKHKYLTFRLGGDVFGVDIEETLEILEAAAFIPIPNAPSYIKGVFNIRGRIMPAVDLAVLLGISAEQTSNQGVIVVEAQLGERRRQLGIVVDEVTDIVDIAETDVESPEFLNRLFRIDFLDGVAKTGDGMRLLLNLARLLTSEQLQVVETIARKNQERESF